MTFKEAFEAMKHGAKVKLPGWNGYWCWDDEKQTIMIHCRPKDSDKGQGDVLDIRETQRVEYTFMHTQRDDWMIADENNCGVLGGQSTFGFGDAIRYLKRGLKVARKGWNGKKQYIQLATCLLYTSRRFRLCTKCMSELLSSATPILLNEFLKKQKGEKNG